MPAEVQPIGVMGRMREASAGLTLIREYSSPGVC